MFYSNICTTFLFKHKFELNIVLHYIFYSNNNNNNIDQHQQYWNAFILSSDWYELPAIQFFQYSLTSKSFLFFQVFQYYQNSIRTMASNKLIEERSPYLLQHGMFFEIKSNLGFFKFFNYTNIFFKNCYYFYSKSFQSSLLVSMGRRGISSSHWKQQVDISFGRLFNLPLVSCDGTWIIWKSRGMYV